MDALYGRYFEWSSYILSRGLCSLAFEDLLDMLSYCGAHLPNRVLRQFGLLQYIPEAVKVIQRSDHRVDQATTR